MTGQGSTFESNQKTWDHEYDHGQIIPSSLRPQVSKALVLYEHFFNFGQISPVLDAGCGNGRNAIYFAKKGCEVQAVDFSESALGLVRKRANEAGVADQIRVSNQCLQDRWSFDALLSYRLTVLFRELGVAAYPESR